jgi:acetyltransferase, GNAT family
MFYEIKTDRLILRPLDISDLATVHTYASDEENTTYMLWLPNDTIEETKQFLNSVTNEWKKAVPNYYDFAIVFEGLQIGAISVTLNDSRNIGELGWILNKRYWKKGIAIEAALAIKDFALNVLKLQKLVAHCDYRNIASSNLMQKLGMTLENDTGTRTYPKNNETVQELTYSLSIHS